MLIGLVEAIHSMAARVALAGVILVNLSSAAVAAKMHDRDAPIVVGVVPLDPSEIGPPPTGTVEAFVEPAPPSPTPSQHARGPRTGSVPRFTAPSERGTQPPNGRPPGPALPFVDAVDDSGGLQFVLILGSDARSGNPEKARSDSIHILAIDPKARRGTVLGIPRDSWVPVAGHGNRKINEALSLGGPPLAVRTIREVTGIPVQYYMLTAFDGLRGIVNELGGADVYVPYDMNDKPSGAMFQRGWHRMDGENALRFSRNRHIPSGDFARSENQGRLMLDVLKKVRAETSTRREIESWLNILIKHVRLEMSFGELIKLGVLARVTASSSVSNVVMPGRVGTAGRASVVYLTDQSHALFKDVAADAIVNGSYPRYGPEPTADPGETPPSPSPLLTTP